MLKLTYGDYMKSKRLVNIDLLKIICIFSVIIIHVSSFNINKYSITKLPNDTFFIANIFNNISRFSVPCFIMISGMFILDKEISIKQLFKKYILKVIIIFIIFCSLYAVYNYFNNKQIFNVYLFFGAYHLWYLLLIMGLYLITPILRLIVKNKQITEYFLILSFIFTSLIPFITNIISIPLLNNVIKHLNLYLPLGYTFYYVAGYYVSKYDVNKKVIYCLGILGVIINIIIFSQIKYDNKLYDNIFLLPGTIFQSISIFILFKDIKIKNYFIIEYTAKHTLSIYLVHLLIINIIINQNEKIIYNNPLLMIPFISIFVFMISLLISITLKSIPLLKKIL